MFVTYFGIVFDDFEQFSIISMLSSEVEKNPEHPKLRQKIIKNHMLLHDMDLL